MAVHCLHKTKIYQAGKVEQDHSADIVDTLELCSVFHKVILLKML